MTIAMRLAASMFGLVFLQACTSNTADFYVDGIEGDGGQSDSATGATDAATRDGSLHDAMVRDAVVADATQDMLVVQPDAALPDAALPDAALPDAALPDAALPDAALPDAALPDAALPDAALPDAALPDAALPDAALPDAALPDAALPDAALADAAHHDAFVNTPPIMAGPMTAMTAEDTAVDITLIGSDADMDSLTYLIFEDPAHGTADIMGTTLTYTPSHNYHGTDTVKVVVNDGTATSTAITIMITITAVRECGDGEIESPENCDDNNTTNGDGCDSSCQAEMMSGCGDGLIQYASGEICDDGNDMNGDGCDTSCQLENPFSTVAAQAINRGIGQCTVGNSNTGRKVAIDALGNIYILMLCEQIAYVVTSTNNGVTYSPPVAISGVADATEGAIAAGPEGFVYVTVLTPSGVKFSRSTNSAVTWSSWTTLSSSTDDEVSLEAFNEDVFIGIGVGFPMDTGTITLLHSKERGLNFTTYTPSIPQIYFDVLYDEVEDTLFLCTDTPNLHLRAGEDFSEIAAGGGTPTFGTLRDHFAYSVYYSDWTATNGTIFVVGTYDSVAVDGSVLTYFDIDDLSTPHTISGLSAEALQNQRAITSDPYGNVYVVTGTAASVIQLDRLPRAASGTPYVAFDTSRRLLAVGPTIEEIGEGTGTVYGFPGVAALPTSDGVVVVYNSLDMMTNENKIWVTLQTYP